jgi:hypothetical protein
MSRRVGKTVQRNGLLLRQIRKHVFERDNFTCQKCGVVRVSPSKREYLIKSTPGCGYPVEVYDWFDDKRLEYVRQITDGGGGDVPESYVTWCIGCWVLERVEQYRVLKLDCPRHRQDFKSCSRTGCAKTSYDTEVAFWLNYEDLLDLRQLAHDENSTCRDLLTEAMHDLFTKYYQRQMKE